MASSPPLQRAGKRAAMSCDRCKVRKTKCVDPVPGPCQFCANLGVTCRVDPSRRRQRPYYHVSEEEFRYMTRALQHFMPDTDINLTNLKELVSTLGSSSSQLPPQVASLRQLQLPADDVSSETSRNSKAACDASYKSTESAPSTDLDDSVTIEEIDNLHGELGWLTVDSKGTYRHVGMEGGYGFNAAVRSLKHRRNSDSTSRRGSDLVAQLTAAPPCPPDTADSSMSITSKAAIPPRQVFLPRKDLCMRCVGRFFRDIHSIYWLFTSESFVKSLEGIYSGNSTCTSASMLCSLYSILALTVESEARKHGAAVTEGAGSKYLSLAKTLAPVLMDEADTDSIRALCLLGIALQSSMCSNTAYVYIGSASRMTFTLGLNLPKSLGLRSSFQGQSDLRTFWTLYLLDLDVALCYGNPPSLSDEDGAETLHLISEQILGPGTNMPLDFLSVSCKLAQLKRNITKLVYARSGAAVGRVPGSFRAVNSAGKSGGSQRPLVSTSDISAALTSLKAWYDSMPPQLRDVTQAADCHKRSVAVLHLRYWSAVIFATRPFLLYNVLHPDRHQGSPGGGAETGGSAAASSQTADGSHSSAASSTSSYSVESKRRYFEEFGAVCLDSATRSLGLLTYMRDAGLLSSLVTFDTACLLEVLQVFLLALAKSSGSKLSLVKPEAMDDSKPQRRQEQAAAVDSVRELLHTMQGMEQIFWTRHALVEVMAQLEEHGLLNGDNRFSPGGEGTPGLFCLDISSHHDIVSEMMESYLNDANNTFFSAPDPTLPVVTSVLQ